MWQEVLKAYRGTKETNRAIRLRSNFRLGYDIIDGLNISSSLAADYAISRRNYFSPSYIASDNNSISIGETGINLMVLNENLLSYKKTIHEDHNIEFMAGFSYQYDQEEYNGGSARKSPSDKIYYAPYGMPDLETVGWGDYTEIRALKDYQSDMQEKTLVSYFARLEYGFREKYLFYPTRWELHVREKQPLGNFPIRSRSMEFFGRTFRERQSRMGIFWKNPGQLGTFRDALFPELSGIGDHEGGEYILPRK